MKNRKKIILMSLSSCLFLFANYTVLKTTGSHPGSTGAPYEKNCTASGCHTGMPVIVNPVGTNTLVFSSIDSTYVPGQTYTITVSVSKPSISKFGFELVALKNIDTLSVGTLAITDLTRTQILSYNINSNLRFSVTHNATGTPALSLNYTQWKFEWTAPPSNEGLITFYYGTNCTNNDGTRFGDQIYNSSFTIKPKSLVSINEYIDENEIKTFYNTDKRELNLSYNLKLNQSIKLSLNDLSGKEVLQLPNTFKAKGKQNELIIIDKSIVTGIYFVNIQIDNARITKKILIQ